MLSFSEAIFGLYSHHLCHLDANRVFHFFWSRPSDITLEKEMATHILVGKIPWTEAPSRLQSMGSQRVGHD